MRERYFDDNEQITKDVVTYWIDVVQADLGKFTDIDLVRLNLFKLRDADMLRYFSLENTGIFAYIISNDFLGHKCLSELMFYIRPEDRGNIKLVRKYIHRAETIAKDRNCKHIKIGANIGYNDAGFIALLKRFGYVDDTLSKAIN